MAPYDVVASGAVREIPSERAKVGGRGEVETSVAILPGELGLGDGDGVRVPRGELEVAGVLFRADAEMWAEELREVGRGLLRLTSGGRHKFTGRRDPIAGVRFPPCRLGERVVVFVGGPYDAEHRLVGQGA